jgi:peptidoglycan/LPS O-acetylase OafA/YrhL
MNIEMITTMIRPFLIFSFSSLLYFYKDKIGLKSLLVAILTTIICFVFRTGILYNIFLIFALTLVLCHLSNKVIIINKLFSNLGKISYSIYLVGFVVQQSIVSIFGGKMNSYTNFIIAVPISIILASIIYYLTNKILKNINKKNI